MVVPNETQESQESKSAFVSASNFVNDERRLVNVTLPETNVSFNDLH